VLGFAYEKARSYVFHNVQNLCCSGTLFQPGALRTCVPCLGLLVNPTLLSLLYWGADERTDDGLKKISRSRTKKMTSALDDVITLMLVAVERGVY